MSVIQEMVSGHLLVDFGVEIESPANVFDPTGVPKTQEPLHDTSIFFRSPMAWSDGACIVLFSSHSDQSMTAE
jgi:hypothetical protein